MITYYLDNTTTPGSPRLVRRINNGHPTTFNNNLGTAVAIDIENLQFSYDINDGANNPGNVGVRRGRSHERRSVHPDTCSPTQIRKINVTMTARSQSVNQPARPGSFATRSIRRSPCAAWRWSTTTNRAKARQDNDNESRFTEPQRIGDGAAHSAAGDGAGLGLAAGMFAAVTMEQRSNAIDRDQTQVYSAAHGGLEKLTADLGGALPAATSARTRPSSTP